MSKLTSTPFPFALTALLAASACASSPEAPPPAAPVQAPAGPSVATASPPADPPAAPAPPITASTEAPAAGQVVAAAARPSPIPQGTVVLHIGDSFALAGFAKALKPRMKDLGVRYEVRAETSSFTTTWSGKIDQLVANTQPDLVIINLGANEVANVDPPAHAPAVRHIVAALAGRPCVWVSPPSWRKDTGISDVIRKSSAPCRYFDSDKLVTAAIPRQSDHIHPTDAGGALWADAFWAWLQDQRAADGDASASDLALRPGSKPLKPSPWRLKPSAEGEHDPIGH
jgi:hypothetical protein